MIEQIAWPVKERAPHELPVSRRLFIIIQQDKGRTETASDRPYLRATHSRTTHSLLVKCCTREDVETGFAGVLLGAAGVIVTDNVEGGEQAAYPCGLASFRAPDALLNRNRR